MSYCVNCGVELAPSEHACPLCQTEVVNPQQPFDKEAPRAFPRRLDLFMPDNNRPFTVMIISLLLALPAAVCLACDLAYTQGRGWSISVIGAMALLWIFIVPMLFVRQHRVLKAVLWDTAAVLGFLFLVEYFLAPGQWCEKLAVPIVVVLAILFVADYLLITKVIDRRFLQLATVLATVPLLLIAIEVSINAFLQMDFRLVWSLIVAIPCVIVALLLLVIDRRQRFKDEMKKRLHV